MSGKDTIRGRHLVVACPDALESCNWDETLSGNARASGTDIDLLKMIAEKLGFTYTVVRAQKMTIGTGKDAALETWTELAVRVMKEADLMLGWWYSNPDRMNKFLLLPGIVDNSPIMVIQKPSFVKPSQMDLMFTFTQPFTNELWALIILSTVVAGLVNFRVEQPKVRDKLQGGVKDAMRQMVSKISSSDVKPSEPSDCPCSNGQNFTEADRFTARSVFVVNDLDGSDTINTWDEATELTHALLYGFSTPGTSICKIRTLQLSSKEITKRMESLKQLFITHHDAEEPLEFDRFWSWFTRSYDDAFIGWLDEVEQVNQPTNLYERITKKGCTQARWSLWLYALPHSVYLAFALMSRSRPGMRPVTWTGKAITIWQGIFGLIVVAAYTANLAAHLSIKPDKIVRHSTPAQLMNSGIPACTRQLMVGMIENVYTDLRYELQNREFKYVEALETGECKAVIFGVQSVKSWMTSTSACGIMMTGMPLAQKINGWVTNRESPCILHALGYAVEEEKTKGTVDQVVSKAYPAAHCDVEDANISSHSLGVDSMGGLIILSFTIYLIALCLDTWKRVFAGVCFAGSCKIEDAPHGDNVRLALSSFDKLNTIAEPEEATVSNVELLHAIQMNNTQISSNHTQGDPSAGPEVQPKYMLREWLKSALPTKGASKIEEYAQYLEQKEEIESVEDLCRLSLDAWSWLKLPAKVKDHIKTAAEKESTLKGYETKQDDEDTQDSDDSDGFGVLRAVENQLNLDL